MTKVPVLIVGGGPTGLVLGLWLTRLGIAVRIIDKTAEPGTTSRALAVQARTLELYRQIGLADAVVAAGVEVENLNFWVEGSRTARVPLRRIGEGLSPYSFALVFPQDAHEKLLVERLDALGVTVERRTELLRFEESGGRIRATLRTPGGAEELVEADYSAGCDGASSTVRSALSIEFPGGTYTGMFYVADVEAEGPAVDRELHIDLDEADFVLLFPLKKKGRVRLVGTLRGIPERDHAALGFDDVSGQAIRQLALGVTAVRWFSTYRVHHRVAHGFRKGRVFLLGDAAHIHSPVGGQGMNTGIGDAVNLAWKLAEVLQGHAAESLLATYEPERIAFARRLVATTDRVFTFVTKRGRVAAFVRTHLVPVVVPLLFHRKWIRRFLFRTVSQINVRYRTSALSEGKAGRIHGGDRLPWVPLEDGRGNFAPLTSLDWQVHVYGDVRQGLEERCLALRLPLHVFGWTSAMKNAGFAQGALYLVRPDGYVALADRAGDPGSLDRYFGRNAAIGDTFRCR